MGKIIIAVLVVALIVGGLLMYEDSKTIPKGAVIPNATTTPFVLSTTYISPVEWPPVSKTEDQAYSCVEGEGSISRLGNTEKISIAGREWCRTILSEGAAGSTYLQYTYTSEDGDKLRMITFTLREVQCGNYNEPERSVCETERANFDPDSIIATMPQV